MFEKYKCIVCHQRKKNNERLQNIEYSGRSGYLHKSRIHLSCVELAIKEPEKYSIYTVDECIHIVKHLDREFKSREENRKEMEIYTNKVLQDAQSINLELFLSKAKGNDLIEPPFLIPKKRLIIDDEAPAGD